MDRELAYVVCQGGATGQLEMVTTNNIGPNMAFVTRHRRNRRYIRVNGTHAIDVEARW